MRQPLEDGTVCIARAAMSLTFPARFMLAAAMNPCPCGFLGDTRSECRCTPAQVQADPAVTAAYLGAEGNGAGDD